MSLKACRVSVTYGYQRVLSGVDLAIESDETVGVLGPSGCGKSTLVRVLALLQAPTAGHVDIDGVTIGGTRHQVPAVLRTKIGVVFQSPRAAVDPRLKLRDIIVEPLRANHRLSEAPRRVAELCELVGLTPDLLDRASNAVSEGQLQRACVARALALEPRYVLSDELSSMLDASTQAHLVRVIVDYQTRTGAGVLAVSHDRVLLDRWADRVTTMAAVGAMSPIDTRH